MKWLDMFINPSIFSDVCRHRVVTVYETLILSSTGSLYDGGGWVGGFLANKRKKGVS